MGGNEDPQLKDIKNILGAVGIEGDDASINFVIAQMKGKDINALIAEGAKKIVAVPAAGAAAPAAAAPAAAAPAAAAAKEDKKAAAAPAKEEKKADKKKEPEPEPEDDGEMGFGLFD